MSELGVRHALNSMILSADDDPGKPTRALVDLALDAARLAADADVSELSARLTGPPDYPAVWPGEHYKLLAGLVQLTQPTLVVEVGTATGLSALALKRYLPEGSRIVTFDVVPWSEYPEHVLVEADFDERLEQVIADLSVLSVAHDHAALLGQADLIFVDAAKDGAMEAKFLDNFCTVGLEPGALLVFDDIRLMNMISIWRQLQMSKLDVTSFGHWSGTGLVRWSADSHWSCLAE